MSLFSILHLHFHMLVLILNIPDYELGKDQREDYENELERIDDGEHWFVNLFPTGSLL